MASNQTVGFELDTTDRETVLYSFTGGADGSATPYAGLIRDSAEGIERIRQAVTKHGRYSAPAKA